MIAVLLFGTPIWMEQPSSAGKLVLERMDALLDATDEQGRMASHSKLAAAATLGIEDSASLAAGVRRRSHRQLSASSR